MTRFVIDCETRDSRDRLVSALFGMPNGRELTVTITKEVESHLAESTATPGNTESDTISALREEVAELRKEVACHRSFVGMHTPLGGDSARF